MNCVKLILPSLSLFSLRLLAVVPWLFAEVAVGESFSYPSPFANQKVHLARQPSSAALAPASSATVPSSVSLKATSGAEPKATGAAAAGISQIYPRGTQFAVLVDTVCRGRSWYPKTESGHEVQQVTLNSEMHAIELEALFESDPCVRGVSEEALVRGTAQGEYNDPRFLEQLNMSAISLKASGQLFWHSSFKINQEVVIAILDSGIQLDHPDLANQIQRNSEGKSGYDFFNNDADPSDDAGHGTHVSGIAAAEPDNGLGVAGVMGWKVKLLPVKVLNEKIQGSTGKIANGIRYAADQGADVINLSLIVEGPSAMIQDAISYAIAKGALVVVAAGNEGQALTADNFRAPVSYAPTMSGLVSVGSIDAISGLPSHFSNFSPAFVDLGAPGSEGVGVNNNLVLSTFLASGYRSLEGTSMSAPAVTGAAGLVIGLLKTLGKKQSPGEIETLLKNGAQESASLAQHFHKGRRLNLSNLAQYLKNTHIFQGSGGFEEGL